MPRGLDGEHPFFFADIIRLAVQHIHRVNIILYIIEKSEVKLPAIRQGFPELNCSFQIHAS
jgi:hypothetical protein